MQPAIRDELYYALRYFGLAHQDARQLSREAGPMPPSLKQPNAIFEATDGHSKVMTAVHGRHCTDARWNGSVHASLKAARAQLRHKRRR